MPAPYVFFGGYISHVSVNLGNGAFGAPGPFLDDHNNAWMTANTSTSHLVKVVDETGAVLQTWGGYTDLVTAMVNLANAHGAGLPAVGASDNAFGLAVLNYGGTKYLTVFCHKFKAGLTFYDMVGIFTTNADGTFSCVATCWTIGAAAFYTALWALDIAGGKTADDYIMVQMGLNSDGLGPQWVAYPTLNQMLAQVASPIVTHPYQWNGPGGSPGDQYHGFALPYMNSSVGINAGGCTPAAFLMPDNAGGTRLYSYIGKSTAQHTSVVEAQTFAATYPNGVMTLTSMSITAPTFGGPTLGSVVLMTPAADPNCFVSNGTPYNAFSDVYAYFDGSGSISQLDYYGVPQIISTITNGFRVAWYAPWFSNDTYLAPSWQIYEKVRIQDYDKTTGLFTDVVLLSGGTANITDIGTSLTQPINSLDINAWDIFQQGNLIKLWHMNGVAGVSSADKVAWLGSIARVPGAVRRQTDVRLLYKPQLT